MCVYVHIAVPKLQRQRSLTNDGLRYVYSAPDVHVHVRVRVCTYT